jgi:NAD(P)-dependent dehydrogenase (short-subunit alcohol dehydrogenase family)
MSWMASSSGSGTHWLRLAHKTAIVTGGGSGIGRAAAAALAEAGCHVLLLDNASVVVDADRTANNNPAATNPTTRNNAGERTPNTCATMTTTTVRCDVSDREQVQRVFASTPRFRSASILVNCAGITRDNFIGNLSDADWDDVLDVNLKGTFHTCQSFVENRLNNAAIDDADISDEAAAHQHNSNDSSSIKSIACTDVSIINVGSVVSERGNAGQVNYAASKGGVLGLTRALAKEVGRHGIRVNAVVPGFIDTPMTRAVPPHVLAGIRTRIPLQNRLGTAGDVADLIAFLASSRSRYISGEAIECSGMIAL